MTYEKYLKSYMNQGLIKPQSIDYRAIKNMINRAYKELKIADANLTIDEGIAYTVAYTAMLHVGRALMLLKGYRPADGRQLTNTLSNKKC